MVRHKVRTKIVHWIWNLAALVIILVPILSIVIGALQTEDSLLLNPHNPLPEAVTLENFIVLIRGEESIHFPHQVKDFPLAFRNSVIVSSATAFLALLFGAFSAYSLVRLRFRGNEAYSVVMLATRLVPVIVLVIPLFLTLRALGFLNTLHGLIVTETGFLLPYVVWILKAYFESLPEELEDAARVDGCTRLGTLFRIILPLSTPGLAACFVITFLLSWNEFLIPVTLGSRREVQTLPVLMSSFVSDFRLEYTIINATALLALTPTVILALALRRYVVAGLTAGATKG